MAYTMGQSSRDKEKYIKENLKRQKAKEEVKAKEIQEKSKDPIWVLEQAISRIRTHIQNAEYDIQHGKYLHKEQQLANLKEQLIVKEKALKRLM